MKTAFVSTYPPLRCGIATFTADLADAIGAASIIAIEPPDAPPAAPGAIAHHIRKHVASDYDRAARWIDAARIDVVSVQHEYGIWGGADGEQVLDFVRSVRVPVVATLHTVLEHPSTSQRRILRSLVRTASATVVMSRSAADLLTASYDTDPSRVEIIPHGVLDLPFVAPDQVKPVLGLEGRLVILSFGLLGPGKGYESVIAAMPEVVRADPSALYVIVGATHPELLRTEGEAYRDGLQALAARLGVADHLRFIGRFVDAAELGTWLEAADIFVTPYPNLEQIVSGTLSYAMGAGKAIVSTPYAYARERLARGRGRLVEPGSTAAMVAALVELAGDPELRASYGRRAHLHSQGMHWPEVGAAYRRLFERVAGTGGARSARSLVAMPVGAAELARA